MKNIVLVGLMGAGKTTVGKKLSEKLKYDFLDTDIVIEDNENAKISNIFTDKGEDYFRQLEHKLCQNLSEKNNIVISTGGGMVQNIENLNYLKSNGFVVYLQAAPEVLFNRIKTDTNRPLLKTDNPLEKLQELLLLREKNYKLANFTINTENKSVDDITNEIIKEYYANC